MDSQTGVSRCHRLPLVVIIEVFRLREANIAPQPRARPLVGGVLEENWSRPLDGGMVI